LNCLFFALKLYPGTAYALAFACDKTSLSRLNWRHIKVGTGSYVTSFKPSVVHLMMTISFFEVSLMP